MPTLFILCGMPYSGKSSVARRLRERVGAELVSLDDINFERGLGFGGDGHITPEQWKETHEIACVRARNLLASGSSVVIDDTTCFLWIRDQYRRLAEELRANAMVFTLPVDWDELVRRRELSNGLRPDVDLDLMASLMTVFEWPSENEKHVVITPDDDSWIDQAVLLDQ